MNIFLKNDEDKANFAKLIEIIKESKKGRTLGVFSKENYPGAFMDAWRAALKTESFDTVSARYTLYQQYMGTYKYVNSQIVKHQFL